MPLKSLVFTVLFDYFSDAEEAHAAAEERKRIRKLRSRRDRCKNGAQFTQNLYPDFRQVERFVQQSSNGTNGNGTGDKKSNSDKNLKGSNKSTPTRKPKNGTQGGKKSKKKFKRSLTMTSLPLSFFKGCTSPSENKEMKDCANGSNRYVKYKVQRGQILIALQRLFK